MTHARIVQVKGFLLALIPLMLLTLSLLRSGLLITNVKLTNSFRHHVIMLSGVVLRVTANTLLVSLIVRSEMTHARIAVTKKHSPGITQLKHSILTL